MYGPSYGFGPVPNDDSLPFNHPHQPQQQQQGQQAQQLPQHIMYNPQAYGATAQQPMYDTSSMAVMGESPEGMAMASQQDTGTANMPLTGGGYQYQTPYTSAPYGVSIPTASSNLPADYFPTSSPGNAAPRPFSMNPQLMNQRIQPPSAPNRASPYGNMQSTPPHAPGVHPQFAGTQGQNATQPLQQQGSNPQAVTTPQTPVFPSSQQGQTGQGNVQMATPLSPGSESREKERVTLLLEINRVLLMAVIELQNAQQAEKKEEAATAASSTPTEEKDKAEKERAEKAKAVSGREYVECMRRLQSNLAYLAAIADRAHKPSSQIPPHPAIMSAPPMASHQNPAEANPSKAESDGSETKKEEGETHKENKEESKGVGGETREERIETLKEQYKNLQALFPDADPKKDPPIQRISEASRQQMQAKAQAQAQAQAQAHGQAGQ